MTISNGGADGDSTRLDRPGGAALVRVNRTSGSVPDLLLCAVNSLLPKVHFGWFISV